MVGFSSEQWRLGTLSALLATVFLGCGPGVQRVVSEPAGPPPFPTVDNWWDANYAFRQPLSFQWRNNETLPARYTVSAMFDHAALVRAGKARTDGDDVRVVRYSGTRWLEMDRVSGRPGFNQSNSEILFALPAAARDPGPRDRYFIYYGHPTAERPPNRPTAIFAYHTAFSDPTAFVANWSVSGTQTAADDYAVAEGALYKPSNTSAAGLPAPPYVNDKVVLTRLPPMTGAHARMRFGPAGKKRTDATTGTPLLDDDLLGMGLCSDDEDADGFYVGVTGGDDYFDGEYVTPPPKTDSKPALGYWVDANTTEFVNVPFDLQAPEHVFEARWIANETEARLNEAPWARWPVGPESADHFCLITNAMYDFYVFELEVRYAVASPPVVAAGVEETWTSAD